MHKIRLLAPADGASTPPLQAYAWTGHHTHARVPPWIHAPGMTNLRDLGGWGLPDGRRLRQGLVYRSSEMNGHVSVQPAGRRVLEQELSIRTDLDLRGEGEDVRPVLSTKRVRWINVPIRPYAEIIRDIHFPGYRRIIELFADRENHPILFHCWGGADRAGTVAYLLHALCGGSSEHLAPHASRTLPARHWHFARHPRRHPRHPHRARAPTGVRPHRAPTGPHRGQPLNIKFSTDCIHVLPGSFEARIL